MQIETNQGNSLFCLERIALDYGEFATDHDAIPQSPPIEDDRSNFVFKTPLPRQASSTNMSAENMLKTPSSANTLPRLSTPLFSSREP
ncbi:unnamed protein product, partial [Nesidiocoris tenuis]